MDRTKDYLKRDIDVGNVYKIVERLQKSHTGATFAIDGTWGCGKSFFLALLEDELKQKKEQECILLHYDCWKYNYYDEPIIPMMSILNDGLIKASGAVGDSEMPDVILGAVEKLKKELGAYAGHIIESKIGLNPYKLYVNSKEEGEKQRRESNIFDEKFSVRMALESVRSEMSKVAKQKEIILIVDELDRCLPEYVVKILESIHHFFSGIDGIVTILAIDTKELRQTILKIYGENTNVDKYLKKIIDFYVPIGMGRLDLDAIYKYAKYISKFNGNQEELAWLKNAIYQIMKDISIREQEKIWKKAELIHGIAVDGILDYACLFVEIFISVNHYYDNLHNADINENKKNIMEFVGSIKNKHKRCYHINGEKYYHLDTDIEGRMIWYLSNLNEEARGEHCGDYYLKDSVCLSGGVAGVKAFKEFIQIIK